MKTKIFIRILVFSCLYMAVPADGCSQEELFRAHVAENMDKMPALTAFSSSCVGFHIRNDFGMKELMFADVTGLWQLQKNQILMSVSHYGYANYGEMELAVGYGRNFGDRFAMTARIFYLMAHARGYPGSHSLCTDFALAYKVIPELWLEANVYNPFVLRYGVVGQCVIPLRFAVGFTYMPMQKLLLSLNTSKRLPGEWEVDARFMTQPMEPLLLAVHCSNNRLGFYIGLIYKGFHISIEAAWYYRISVSPQLGGRYYFDGL